MHDFRRLRVWQASRSFAVTIDAMTRRFPPRGRGAVGAQLRRAALSIPANIAEGCGKSAYRETIRFMQIAAGSAREVEHHLLMARDLGYLGAHTLEEQMELLMSIQRMLNGLMNKLATQRGEIR